MDLKNKLWKLWGRFRQWYADSVRKLSSDGPLVTFSDIVYFGGILMIGIGIGDRYGMITAGVLMVLTVRPLWTFIRK